MRNEINRFIIEAVHNTETLSKVEIVKNSLLRARRAGARKEIVREFLDMLNLEIIIENIHKKDNSQRSINCPYCGKLTPIDTSGKGYQPNGLTREQCTSCGERFVFRIDITVRYIADKATCLTNGEHIWSPDVDYPHKMSKMCCEKCGKTRRPTKEEARSIY